MSALPPNTSTTQAKLIQRALNEKQSQSLVVDGQFGPSSINVLEQYQQAIGVPVSGVYDSATHAVLGPFIAQKYLSDNSFTQAAQKLGTNAATVQTVCSVETSGAGFFNNGQCAILFERAQFYRTLNTVIPAAMVTQLAAQYPNIVNSQGGGYQGGVAEYARLEQAQTICTASGVNPDLALRCASWGLFQIMGYYYVQAGYPSVEAFTQAMQVSEDNQLEAFVSYVQDMNGGHMLAQLTSHDWLGFAKAYNGSGEASGPGLSYDQRLSEAYAALTS